MISTACRFCPFCLSSHSPVDWSLRRVLLAIRRLHTAVPPLVCRSSGSRVRLPVRTTRLMFVAAMRLLFLLLLEDRRSRVHRGSERSGAHAHGFAEKCGVFRGAVTRVAGRDAIRGADQGRRRLLALVPCL